MKTFKQFLESIESRIFFHGSSKEIPVGTILKGRTEQYEKDWGFNPWYKILEKYRPKNMISHKDAVFMTDNTDDLELAGAVTDWIFKLKPLGKVERHDVNWNSEIESLLSSGHDENSMEVIEAANNYWSGIPHPNESVWEYLTNAAEIIEVEEGY